MLVHVKLARVNTILLAAIILINGYIILLPLLPKILFWGEQHNAQKMHKLESSVSSPLPKTTSRPSDNRLIVPSMVFDEQIHDGPTAKTLRQGLWRRPQTSSPDKGGNTVIVGHRLTYSNPRGTLYNLDKVHVGDDIGIWWNSKRYHYKVTETKVVKPDQISIEAPTNDPTLTIYTCTPLWMPKDRLVVVAKLEDVQ